MLSNQKFSNILSELKEEESRNREVLPMTANESFMSPLAQKWQAAGLNGRYVFGAAEQRGKKSAYFFKENFSVRGIPPFDELENLAKDVSGKIFHCADAEFRPLSGIHGMISVLGSLTDPGDLIAVLPPQFIGHFITAKLLERMGRKSVVLPYDADKFELDMCSMEKIAQKNEIKMVYLDTMQYFKPYPLKEIKKIFPRAILVYDASHVLGLIAGGQFQNPLKEEADILNGNTHKTLPGPQKGVIFYKDPRIAEKSKEIIGDSFVSSSHAGSTAALFITLMEMAEFGKAYAKQTVKNSQALAKALFDEGFSLLAYPEIQPLTHQVFLVSPNGDKKDGIRLMEAGVTVNSFPLFGHKEIVRFGTQQITRLGMKESEMAVIAKFISRVLKNNKIAEIKNEISGFRKNFQKIHYCYEE